MADENTQLPGIKVSESAGGLDALFAAGRILIYVLGSIPVLMTFIGTRDLIGFIAFWQSQEGLKLGAAIGSLITIGWGLWKTWRRGRQLAKLGASRKVPDAAIALK